MISSKERDKAGNPEKRLIFRDFIKSNPGRIDWKRVRSFLPVNVSYSYHIVIEATPGLRKKDSVSVTNITLTKECFAISKFWVLSSEFWVLFQFFTFIPIMWRDEVHRKQLIVIPSLVFTFPSLSVSFSFNRCKLIRINCLASRESWIEQYFIWIRIRRF